MAKLKIKLANIYASKNESAEIMKRLQEMAVMDISTASQDNETAELPDGYYREGTEEKCRIFERYLFETENALKILNEKCPEKKGMLAFLEGPRELERKEFYLSEENQLQISAVTEKTIETEAEIANQRAEIVRLTALSEQMIPWLNLDVPLNFSGTDKTASFIGSVSGVFSLEDLYTRIAEINPEITVYAEIISVGKDATYIFVSCSRSVAKETENTLRELGFSRPLQLTDRLPNDEYSFTKERIDLCEREIQNAIERLKEYALQRESIEIFADFCRARLEALKATAKIAETENTVMIKGYIAEKDAEFLINELNREFTVVVEIEDADENLAPVRLKNNAFSTPAETITQMYSLPSARDIDPTPLTGFFYYLLFGMMLSDAGYGLLMVLGTGILLKKFNLSQSMRKNMKLFLYCGISTVFWGLIFGSFFGDSIAVISKTFFDKEIKLPALIDPMNGGAVTLLILSLVIGLAQIIAGLMAKFITHIKNGEKPEAFFDAGLWITTLVGVGILAFGLIGLPVLTKVGAVISIASLLGLILTQGRAHKNIVLRLLVGIKSLYDITSYVSDLLSFSRLMALGLTTAAMGAVFNLLGTLGGKGIGGVILMLIIFPVGHAISFALNALGAYVHTLRLQYVELFSKFYDGGGREFKSFSIKNKYVDLKKDIKEEI